MYSEVGTEVGMKRSSIKDREAISRLQDKSALLSDKASNASTIQYTLKNQRATSRISIEQVKGEEFNFLYK